MCVKILGELVESVHCTGEACSKDNGSVQEEAGMSKWIVGMGQHDRMVHIVLFVLLCLCFAYTLPRWADPNQNSRLDMVFAVVEDGTFQIDKYVENTEVPPKSCTT